MMNIDARFDEAVCYIENLTRFTNKHPLVHTQAFMQKLSNPSADKKVIHVAGTNGKGSVCAILNRMLCDEGFHVGLFTSPHLVCMTERIRIDGEQVPKEDFLRAFSIARTVACRMEEEGEGHPSYFEFLYGVGMLVFAESPVEYVILETGLGGRLDATNSFESPILTVITSISPDHQKQLGSTLFEIAAEKAGILKSGIPLVFDASDERVAAVIRERAAKLCIKCREISESAFEIREEGRKYIDFSRVNAYDKEGVWRLSLAGSHQAMNGEIALQAMELLTGSSIQKEHARKESLKSVRWEGRMEEAADRVVVDGAHNPDAVRRFVRNLQRWEVEDRKRVILFTIAQDKDYDRMIKYLADLANVDCFVASELPGERKVPAHRLKELLSARTDVEVIALPVMEEAFRTALIKRGDQGILYCVGSLYLVGEIKRLIAEERK